MSHKRSLSDKISAFFYGKPTPPFNELASGQPTADVDGGSNDLAEQVRKLAKTQFKANAVQEKQLAQHETTLQHLQAALERLQTQQAEQVQQAVENARQELLKSLLPTLDSLDAAFETGRRQVLKQKLSPESRRAIVAWLDGVRLARLRLLDVLEAHQIARIPTKGHPFDPHLHLAVATDSSGKVPDGIIVAEDRAGYTAPTTVLRFAEVVVSRR